MDHTLDLEKNPAQVLMEKERTKAFLKAVQNLPENQRIAYTLHHMEEFSYKEISEKDLSNLSDLSNIYIL